MSLVKYLALAATIGYVMGSLPIGYVLIYLFKGIDLRQQGSGRTGGTNALRAGGTVLGVLTALGDLAKGAGAIWILRAIVPEPAAIPWTDMAAGVFAVVGHNWSLFLGFKGGAGTGPNLGVSIALWPALGLSLIPVGVATWLLTGYASVTSLVVAFGIPAGLAIRAATGHGPWQHAAYGTATGLAVVVALLPNIKRLIAGTERIVGPRAKAQQRRLNVRKHS